MTENEMDILFRALAHETRRTILDALRDRPGLGVGELARLFDVSRIAVMNHLEVLTQAGLVISKKDGRTRRLYLNVVPIQMIQDRWMNGFSVMWASRLTGLKYAAEADEKQKRRTTNE
ncbi:ArsR/SmtB family transcription factor [Kordiimonas sp.]|uniref:ArsR/SmtB family transcription factor n=1 Tax=Kordiimonas sp. TaxID=1970157 RepID=UPI003A903D41